MLILIKFTVFPNVDIALRIFMSMAMLVCSAKRSFSALKRVKNYLRSSMEKDRLTHFAVLSIEKDLVNELDIEYTVIEFAAQKFRKRAII